MNIDFTQIDKSDFECIQMNDEGQVFFGQSAFFHEETGEQKKELPPSRLETQDSKADAGKSGKATPKKVEDTANESGMDEEDRAKFKKLRNGLGIQLYGKTPSGATCKYAGEWVKDEKTGDGHSIFPDGSEYKGYCIKGIFNGDGIYTWPANEQGQKHQYVGKWIDGKMQGKGEFFHADGLVHKGYFVNNLFVVTQMNQKFFLSPFDTKETHLKLIQLQLKSKEDLKAKAKQSGEVSRVFQCGTLGDLQQTLVEIKNSNRTPVIVSSSESNFSSQNVLEALQNDGTERNIQALNLRDIHNTTKQIPYDDRPIYISQEMGLNDEMITHMVTGAQMGQIFLNLDEMDEGSDNIGWQHLYDPDYKLIINKFVFPEEILQGKLLGDHIIHELQLFDKTLTPQNIAFSNSGADSHTIQFSPPQIVKGMKGSELNASQLSRTQGSAMSNHKSQTSPRSNLTDQKRIERQKERLDQLRLDALAKMEGLDHFQFMIWSKMKISMELKDETILQEFKKRFSHSLPLKHCDLVVVTNLSQ